MIVAMPRCIFLCSLNRIAWQPYIFKADTLKNVICRLLTASVRIWPRTCAQKLFTLHPPGQGLLVRLGIWVQLGSWRVINVEGAGGGSRNTFFMVDFSQNKAKQSIWLWSVFNFELLELSYPAVCTLTRDTLYMYVTLPLFHYFYYNFYYLCSYCFLLFNS